jgi:hypothetical protein
MVAVGDGWPFWGARRIGEYSITGFGENFSALGGQGGRGVIACFAVYRM